MTSRPHGLVPTEVLRRSGGVNGATADFVRREPEGPNL